MESALITAVIVEASEYPDLVRKYRVSGVPMTVANETVEILGARPEEDFIRTAIGAAVQNPAGGSGLIL